ncbi:MAG: DNA repair protein RecN [Alphaproteobacteria bacterium]|nr:DNA repair protein RecN [Alphaproteobacteria bacterium]MDD9920130.1 DNA repair protein RecN [Alphaproteobacteria bacterium]
MLERLYIRNIALIQETELVLQPDLTVVTGETGAGKSMLMDALGLALGERAESSLLRDGAEEALVEACFIIPTEALALRHTLQEQGIPTDDDELILRRILTQNGKSRALANGMRLTQQQLQSIGERLADIHGQHDHQLLLRPQRHAEMLDRFGNLRQEREKVRFAWAQWGKLQDKLNAAQERIAEQEREENLLTAFLEELENLNYNSNEEEHLSSERNRLMASEQTVEALQQVVQGFGDERFSQILGQAERTLSAAAKGGQDIAALAERVSGVSAEIQEILRDAELLVENNQPDPEMLQQVDNRLNSLNDAARKHRVSVKELAVLRDKFSDQLEELSLLQDGLDDLEKREKKAWESYKKVAQDLSQKRRAVAKDLVQKVEQGLKKLKMETTQFHCDFEELKPEQWGPCGCERVRFLIAVNPGSMPQSLEKVASGGEVSRLMLALKEVFFAAMPSMTLVFDEIDTGIGGAVADAVGDALTGLAEKHQVLVITHQPQVAAKGKQHLKIQKLTDGQTARTTVAQLDRKKRQEELARMLSGKEVTKAAREAAQSLLGAA